MKFDFKWNEIDYGLKSDVFFYDNRWFRSKPINDFIAGSIFFFFFCCRFHNKWNGKTNEKKICSITTFYRRLLIKKGKRMSNMFSGERAVEIVYMRFLKKNDIIIIIFSSLVKKLWPREYMELKKKNVFKGMKSVFRKKYVWNLIISKFVVAVFATKNFVKFSFAILESTFFSHKKCHRHFLNKTKMENLLFALTKREENSCWTFWWEQLGI